MEGISIVKKYLVKAFNNPNDLESRANMLVGSAMGSTAFQKGLGAIHSLSHPVGAIYNTHHGLTNAVFMPYVLIKNKNDIEEKVIAISRYINLSHYTFDSFLEWILQLRKDFNMDNMVIYTYKDLFIPHTLKELIEDGSKFNEMSKMALDDPSTSGNPTKLSQKDFEILYQNAYEGNL